MNEKYYVDDYEREIKRDKNSGKDKPFPWSVLILISVIIFIFSLVYSQFLPLKIEFILVAIIAALGIIGVLVRNKIVKGLIIGFTLLLSGLMFFGQGQINKLVGNEDTKTHKLSFVVLEDSPLKVLDDSKGVSFGYSEDIDETLWDKFKDERASTYQVEDDLKTYGTSVDLAQGLYDGEIDVILLDEARRDELNTHFETFDEDTRVLGDFETKSDAVYVEAKRVDVAKEPFIVMISGVDTVGSISQPSRSDVNILMAINPNTNKILMVSIPRDTYLEIPEFGYEKDKITHTGLYGIEATQETLENYFGLNINYYAKFNFTSVINILEIIGPIDVYSHYTFSAKGYNFTEGMNTVGPEQALVFARARKEVPGGDNTRGVHQMEIIKGVIKKMLQPSQLLNLTNVIDELARNVETNMSSSEASSLIALQLANGGDWDIDQIQLQGEGMTGNYSHLIPGQNIYVMEPFESSKDEILQKIKEVMDYQA